MKAIKLILIIVIKIYFAIEISSQTVAWEWSISGGGVSDDIGKSIFIDSNSDIIVCGLFNSTAFFDSLQITSMTYWGGGFISKIDTGGNFQWVKCISGTNYTNISSVATDMQGNIFITGDFKETSYIDSVSIISYDHSDGFIGKFNPHGELLWIKTFGFKDMDGGIDLISNDTMVFLCGVFKDSIYLYTTLLISNGNTDIFIASLDSYGNYQWIEQIGGTWWDVPRSISIDNNNDIILSGILSETVSFGNTDTSAISNGSSDAFIAKYSTNGDFYWVKSFGGIEDDGNIAASSDFENNIFLSGFFKGNVYFDGIPLTSYNEYDYFICKLSTNGSVIWAKKIETTFYPIEDFWNKSLICDESGNLYITGWYRDSLVYDSLTVQSNGSYDIFVMKIDNNGNLIWCLTAGNNHSYGDYSRSIARDGNGNLYITGRFYSTLFFGDSSVTSYGSADVFVAKLHEDPVSVVYNEDNTSLEITVYPNPATDYVNIGYPLMQFEKVEIVSIKGRVLRTFNGNQNILDVSGLASGVYLLKLDAGKMIYVKRIIIQ